MLPHTYGSPGPLRAYSVVFPTGTSIGVSEYLILSNSVSRCHFELEIFILHSLSLYLKYE